MDFLHANKNISDIQNISTEQITTTPTEQDLAHDGQNTIYTWTYISEMYILGTCTLYTVLTVCTHTCRYGTQDVYS